jgi:NAD(P)-dependent dehydrogenase (short-subunit alcohol dehydrogenase family)
MAERRVALVSGANRGIGLEVVRQLAKLGMTAVLGSRDGRKGAAAAVKLASEGIEAPLVALVALDVTDANSVTSAVADVHARFGRIDVLVNNAGIALDGSRSPVSSVLEVSPEVVARTLDANTLGPLRLIQAIVPLMRAQGYGRIVNVSSGLGQILAMGGSWPGYRMSKAALNALTRIVAAELGSANVKVNAMSPGWVRTDMGGASAPRSVAQGADTIVWLATLPDDGPTGLFFEDRKPIAW